MFTGKLFPWEIQFKSIWKKAYRLGSDIYRLDFHNPECPGGHVTVVLDAEFGTIHCV